MKSSLVYPVGMCTTKCIGWQIPLVDPRRPTVGYLSTPFFSKCRLPVFSSTPSPTHSHTCARAHTHTHTHEHIHTTQPPPPTIAYQTAPLPPNAPEVNVTLVVCLTLSLLPCLSGNKSSSTAEVSVPCYERESFSGLVGQHSCATDLRLNPFQTNSNISDLLKIESEPVQQFTGQHSQLLTHTPSC